MPDNQPVQGPDGQLYQFPQGTTKDQAIAYFKKKGIGAPKQIEIPDATKQAQAAVRKPLEQAVKDSDKPSFSVMPTPMGGAPIFDSQASRALATAQPKMARVGGETAGALLGGEAVAPLAAGSEAVAGGSKLLKGLLPLIARSSGVGIGAGAGSLATGSSPKEALATSGEFATMEAGGELAGAAIKKGAKLAKDVTKSKVTELQEAHAAKAAEDEALYQKKLAEHKERVQAIKDDYAEKLQEHATETKTASVKQSAAEAKTGAALEHQNDLAGLLKENLELTHENVARQLGKEFDSVSDAVQAKNPKVNVTDAQRTARSELYFPDSVSAFNRIMENVSSKLKMSDYGILRKTYSQLNDVLYGGGEMPTDLYKAVKTVRDSLGKDLQTAADQAGLGGKYRKAMREYSDYKDTWTDKSSIAKGGSPIRRILDAEDPAFVIDQLKGKAGQRLLDDIGKYQKFGADKALAGRLKSFIERVKSMPSSAGEIPKAPARPEFPKAPERPQTQPFNREEVARQILVDRIRKMLMYGGAAAGGGYLYEKFGGGQHPPVP